MKLFYPLFPASCRAAQAIMHLQRVRKAALGWGQLTAARQGSPAVSVFPG